MAFEQPREDGIWSFSFCGVKNNVWEILNEIVGIFMEWEARLYLKPRRTMGINF